MGRRGWGWPWASLVDAKVGDEVRPMALGGEGLRPALREGGAARPWPTQRPSRGEL